MGNIYNDVKSEGEDTEVKRMVDNLLSVGLMVESRNDVKYREDEINRVYNIMDKTDFRTVMLVGDFGLGKRTIIEGYVNKLYDNVRNDRVIEVDFNEVIKKAQNNDFGKIINDIFYVAGHNETFDVTLVINNIGHLLNLNCYGNAGFSFVNTLINAIEKDNVKIIATVTNDEYKTIDEMFKRVLDFFTVIKPVELTVEQSMEVIDADINFFQDTYEINLPENISDIICTNADKYIKSKPFPGKAEHLLDEVCSSIVNKYRKPDTELINISNEVSELKLNLQEAIEKNEYETCDNINNQITEKLNRIEEIENGPVSIINVTEADVLEAIGLIVNVKMSKLSKDQTEFLREMPAELKKNVIGQDEAIDTIVKNIRRNKLGLRKTSHSAGNFMFIGSTGVGKTYLAKQLAKYLYGSETNFLRLDMSEFQSEIDVSKLLGSAPGYVGYKESGLLVKGLAKKPDTVVLFDEIEKAHPKIYDVLLQLLDEGFITGSDGQKVDATKSLIIFTSNIGVRQAREMANPLGFSSDSENKKNERKEKIIRKALKNRFSPEFLNRLDNICYFNSLSYDTLKSILYKELDETNTNIKALTGKTIEFTPEVETWILDKVKEEDNGARPIIRTIQQNIEETISDMIINDDIALNTDNTVLTAVLENDKIIIK